MSYTLLERVEKKGNEIIIPYTKYRLNNGLTVIIHEDSTNPLVHVDVTYHVGSGREEIGKSGFAHFFEHMMFEGSKHVANNEHFKFISEAGGTLNGTTNRDRTNYFETLPSNQLDLALWLESDRMGFLIEAMTEESFQNQLSVIKNEKAQRYENQPYGMTTQVTGESLYPINHPYSWTTIGYTEDLDRVSTKDMKQFFKRWYGPNNATLTIGGDIKAEEAIEKVATYFGDIPTGPAVEKPVYNEFSLPESRYVSYQDTVRFPMLQVSYPSVKVYHEDEPALDLLSDIIGSGKNSMLHKRFVKTQKSVQAYCSNYCFEGAGEFTIGVFAYPGIHLKDVEAELNDMLESIHQNGINAEDLERSRVKYYSKVLYGLESVKSRVSRLASYQLFAPDSNYVGQDIERYRDITVQQIMDVFHKYVYGQKRVSVSFYDEQQKELLPADDNFTFQREGLDNINLATEEVGPIGVTGELDRTTKPEPGDVPVVKVPNYYEKHFDNGLSLMGVDSKTTPTVSMLLSFKAGSITDPDGQSGRSAILASMLKESTEKSTAEEISARLELLGSSISAYNSKEKLNVSVSSLSENLTETMKVLEEVLFYPAFKADELDRIKKEQQEMLAFEDDQPDVMANRAFYQAIYGTTHPLGQPASGRISEIPNITAETLKQLHSEFILPNNATWVVSGDVNLEELVANSEFLQNWSRGADVRFEVPEASFERGGKILVKHKEGAPQSEIRIGYPAMPYDATGEFYKAGIMNYVLGSAFNSRINLNIREDKGYTYGARSYFSGGKFQGPFIAAAAVGGDVTANALKEFMYELRNYRDNGITEDELVFTKQSLLNKDALKYETNSQRTNFLFRMLEFGLNKSYVEDQKEILANIASAEVNRLAKKYLPVENMVMVIAGDSEKITSSLEELGLGEIIQLDKPIETT